MEPDISFIAGLIGDTARSKMLTALMGGKALTATELALEADITPQTASSHLAKLVEGQLLVVRKQGRHRYFQLSGTEIAGLLETLLNMSSLVSSNLLSNSALTETVNAGQPKNMTGPRDPRMRKARICYDHLAGEISVALYDALQENRYIIDHVDNIEITADGAEFFKNIGFDTQAQSHSKRPICRACLDWSERRNHIAGLLGQWILTDTMNNGWVKKDLNSRVLEFTSIGQKRFYEKYQLV